MKILTPDQENVLQRERNFLNDLRLKLVEYNASRDHMESLGQSIRQLDDLFLLVIVGEFNAGKSAFINALLGEKMLKEGVTPTTSQVTTADYVALFKEHAARGESLLCLSLSSGIRAASPSPLRSARSAAA